MSRQGIAILGVTGSIGRSALRVIARHPERFVIRGVVANSNRAALDEILTDLGPVDAGLVQGALDMPDGWLRGSDALIAMATRPDVDIVINAVVGAAGLAATLAALEAGKRVALANKESLVMGGHLVLDAARRGGGSIVPVDSEHSAILQCLGTAGVRHVSRLVLTASGGPFRTWSAEQVARARVEDALQHPTWSMGRKITVDSATLANKALEVIEAHYLFGIGYDAIDVVVHPQSVVHSMVEFVDRSVVAQLGVPSMELPILYALTHPDRLVDRGVPAFDPVTMSPLTFEPVRHDVFPTLRLGIQAGSRGGAAPAVFNAANEEAVAAFLEGAMDFAGISGAIDRALGALQDREAGTLDDLVAADAAARDLVRRMRRL